MQVKYFKSTIWISGIALLIAAPILIVCLSWLFPQQQLWSHFLATILPNIISSSAILLLGVGIGTGFLGTILAYLVVMVEFPGRRWLELALFMPFAIPAYVLAFVYLGVFDYSGYAQTWLREALGIPGFDIRNGWFAITATFILAFYPYVYMLARASFERQKIQMLEVGKTLGANHWSVFWRISLPLARPAIAAGVLITLMEVLADFGVVGLFNYDTFTTAIYSAWSDFRSIEAASQLASILLLIIFFLIYFEKKARGKAKYYSSEIFNKRPYCANGVIGWLISAFVLGVFMLAFAMPVLQLVIWGVDNISVELNSQYINLITSTLILTLSSVFLIITIATILAFPRQHNNNSKWLNSVIHLATLGYALPGSVMAVGLLYGVNQISAINIYFGGESINYIIFSSIFLLLFAYISRFIAISYNSIEASVEQIKPEYIYSAKLLGAKNIRMAWLVLLPIMRPGILAGGLLVAMDVIKELPATYLLRPLGWDTLAIHVYELSAEGLFERAAVPALIMVLFGVVILFIFKLLNDGRKK